ncbi:MAG: di-trans,poly-cis-decaprenylcistransferase [Holosporaceae bacterium]|jgi:undecaprenyl diphosphate synthase|nr:di-trans,poly-cis-decaprenylcistransferase [Holosporaceae bacterium]
MTGVPAELAVAKKNSHHQCDADPEIFAPSPSGDKKYEDPKELRHLAFILDGNRRWAKARNLLPVFGHRKGYENAKKIISSIAKYGVKYITYYIFSQENWKRSGEEVKFLMDLLRELFYSSSSFFHKNNARLLTIGNLKDLPEDIQQSIAFLENETKSNDGITLIMAISYSGRDEILRAVKKIAQDAMAQKINLNTLTEDDFSQYMDTKNIPYPDAIIRTSEQRISNFLLWQCAYSEIFFVDKFWPDFSEEDLENIANEFFRRKRRYGR